MSLSTIVRAMTAAGCTAEQICAAVEAYESDQKEKLAERRAKDAERKRRQRHAESRDVTRTERDRSDAEPAKVSPTPPSKNNTPQEIPPTGDISVPPTKKPNRRGARLPDDWWPDEQDRAFAAKKGLSPRETDLEAEKFRNYWHAKPGAGGVKLDWPKTWQNWCINAAERRPNNNSPPDKHSRLQAAFAETRKDFSP